MPPSADSNETYRSPPGQTLAVVAESLYLLNLLLAPGLAFVALVVVYLRTVRTAPPLAVCHLRQTLSASLWAGVILVIINASIVVFGGYDAPYTWMFVVLYFTACHSVLIFLGMMGLAKAMAGKAWRYPLVGRACPEMQAGRQQ
ncbi:MAG: cytochrome C oxidase subunit III [Acidithiobacillales bacterium SG8_45]|jgi:uncharacterized Tic20 family protein|nr:MAG: cytochrome C oxidase subunit III [Acidithiobacillales bacterium SG8_45]